MFALFAIVAAAVLVVVLSKLEGAKPLGLALAGALCVILGSRAAAVLTTTSFESVAFSRAVAAEEDGAESRVPASSESPQTTHEEGDATPASDQADTAPLDEPAESSGSALDDEPVEFITNIRYLTPNRPDWLDSKLRVGDVRRVSVKAGPHYRMRQCVRELDEELKTATSEFITNIWRTRKLRRSSDSASRRSKSDSSRSQSSRRSWRLPWAK